MQEVHLESLRRTIERRNEEIQQILNAPARQVPEVSDAIQASLLLPFITSHVVTYTNFSMRQLVDLWFLVQPFFVEGRKQGPKPIVWNLDALIVLLLHYKSYEVEDRLASLLNLSSSTLEDSIKRTRPILLQALTHKYWNLRRRPVALQETSYPYIALLVDTNSQEIFKPAGVFNESKQWWDEHNRIYAIKKEVAVTATPPHIALFVQSGKQGSEHDFALFKENYPSYLTYLLKETDEHRFLPMDHSHSNWAILGDKAYSTIDNRILPGLRKVSMKKAAETTEDIAMNNELSRIRCPVECFFGRMEQLWKMTADVYRNSHSFLDEDYNICVLLTNFHVEENSLEEKDYHYHLDLLARRIAKWEKSIAKEKESHSKYYENRKNKFNGVF